MTFTPNKTGIKGKRRSFSWRIIAFFVYIYPILVLRSISKLLINVGNILKKHSSYSLKTLFTVINGVCRIVLNYYPSPFTFKYHTVQYLIWSMHKTRILSVMRKFNKTQITCNAHFTERNFTCNTHFCFTYYLQIKST